MSTLLQRGHKLHVACKGCLVHAESSCAGTTSCIELSCIRFEKCSLESWPRYIVRPRLGSCIAVKKPSSMHQYPALECYSKKVADIVQLPADIPTATLWRHLPSFPTASALTLHHSCIAARAVTAVLQLADCPQTKPHSWLEKHNRQVHSQDRCMAACRHAAHSDRSCPWLCGMRLMHHMHGCGLGIAAQAARQKLQQAGEDTAAALIAAPAAKVHGI